LGKIHESGGLTAVDSLIERAVEEGVLHIKLLNQSITGGSNGEHRADGGRFDNRAESLVVVHIGVLCETPEDSASLVLVESPIKESLVREYPFAGDDVGASRPGNKFPCPIAQQGPILFLHSCPPIWIGKRGANRSRDWRRRRRDGRGGEDEGLPRHPEASLGVCDHLVRILRGSHRHRRDRSVRGRHRCRRCGCYRSRRLTWTMDVRDR
jgi:hypothetical protein